MVNYSRQNGYLDSEPTGVEDSAHVLPLNDLILILKKRVWIIVLVAMTTVGLTIGFSLMQSPVYSASIKILVGQERAIAENPFDVRGLQDMTGTVAQAVESRPIAEAVIEQEGLRTNPGTFLAENLEVSAIEETQFVTVSYRDSDPQRAQRVVNAVGDVFSKRMAEISPGSSGITVTVWERAVAPGAPISPNPVRNGLLALMLGVVLGTGLAILVQLLDDSWRSPEEVEQVSGVPTLGVIPAFALPKGAGKAR